MAARHTVSGCHARKVEDAQAEFPRADLIRSYYGALPAGISGIGDERLRQALIGGTPRAPAAMGGWGKGFTQYTRVAPFFIEHLASLR